MKKYIILILLVFLLTGCVKVNNLTTNEIIDAVFSEESNTTNTAIKGYKLYLPRNMTLVKDKESNNVLYTNNKKYYLYVDLISYYNKSENDYKINTDKTSIFSKILNYNDKKGYVLVTEYNDEYFVEVMYNYGKIEVITDDINDSIANSLIVLKSIKYNDTVIESLIGKNILNYDEEEFSLLGPSANTDQFLEYEINDKYEDIDNEIPDEDKIEIEKED